MSHATPRALVLLLAAFLLACGGKLPASTEAGAAAGLPSLEKAAFETARQNAAALQKALAAYRVSGESTRFPEGTMSYPVLADFLSDYALPRTEQEAGYAAFSYEGTGGDDYLVTLTADNVGKDVITVTPAGVTPSAWPGR